MYNSNSNLNVEEADRKGLKNLNPWPGLFKYLLSCSRIMLARQLLIPNVDDFKN